ncbi:MAG TPA: G-D-S-L family lipolytic protein [Cyanobacteria bacterium UBA8543]|nr:G-D-S-L family lipolytic protein [Cyanobacteria bacterium UBA8543]
MQTLVARSSQSFRQTHRTPLKLVVLGDSIIYGFGDPEGGGWVERLRRQWMSPDSPGHVLYNLGIRGDGVKQVQERVEQEFRNRGELKNRVPDAIILSVGVNDSARLGRPNGRNFLDFDNFQKELANLLDQAQGLCPVLFVGMVPVNEAKMPFLDCFYYNHADQYRYKEATRVACMRRQIPYLDIFDTWMERGTDWLHDRLCSDGLHPNVAGYQALLQDVTNWDALTQLTYPNLSAA